MHWMKLGVLQMVLATVGLVTAQTHAQMMGIGNEEPRNGGFFVEPSLTYERGDWDLTYPSPLGNSSGEMEGWGLGVKGGLHFADVFYGGLDYNWARPQFRNSGNNYTPESNNQRLGVLVGGQTPYWGVRLWATYYFWGEVNPDEDNGLNVKFDDGQGFKVGAGVRFGYVGVNLEYLDLKHERATLQQVGPFSPGTDFTSVDLRNKTWLLSASVPLFF